ncbi:MAG: RagB/SusD family nutrient uptake outer membrane protein [Alistipes sp.]|nr:RagB/SusD family nutrient uptake outer membrane protein [Alistipes sp.]
MKAIIDERALEFAGEFPRKQDLIRWGLLKIKLDEAKADMKALANMEGPYAAYAAYTEEKELKKEINKVETVLFTYPTYYVYWREKGQGIEFFGLDADEIGKTPAGYVSKEETGGWKRLDYLSTVAFCQRTATAEDYNNEDSYRWTCFYKNAYNDPYPRSTWPLFGQNLNNAQGALVNDYGYDNL